MTTAEIQKRLKELSEPEYKKFSCRLMPTVDKSTVLGVRVPALRKLAREIFIEDNEGFLTDLPHTFFEENHLHAFIISQTKDFEELIKLTEEFLPYIDNWAVCDSFRPKLFKKERKRLLPYVLCWLESDKTYTVRYAIECLMIYFLDDDFDEKFFSLVAKTDTSEYYLRLMVAWYFSQALVKRWDIALPYLDLLDEETAKITAKKTIESYAVELEKKKYLNEKYSLGIKNIEYYRSKGAEI